MTVSRPLLTLLLAGALVAVAPPDADAQRRRNRPLVAQADAATKRERVRKRLRAARAWKLTEALDLSEKDAARLFPVLNKYDEKFFALQRDGAKLRRALKQQLASGAANQAEVNHLIEQSLAQQQRVWELGRQRFAEVRRVLSPAQAAKALYVLPEIDRAILREIRKAVRGKRGRRGRGADIDSFE